VIIPTHCPILGIELKFGKVDAENLGRIGPRGYPNSPSIDRIDNTKGYTKENIMVVSWRANVLKSDGTPEEFYLLNKFINKGRLSEEDNHYW